MSGVARTVISYLLLVIRLLLPYALRLTHYAIPLHPLSFHCPIISGIPVPVGDVGIITKVLFSESASSL